MGIVGVILARGGSKGIPKKNLQAVGGVPLVRRVASEALESNLDLCYVYSDDLEIRSEFKGSDHRLVAMDRPVEVSGDMITSEATIQRFIQDTVCKDDIMLIQCTTPFLKKKHINRAIELFTNQAIAVDSVLTATRFHHYLGYPRPSGVVKTPLWVPVFPYRWLRQESSMQMYMENGGLYLAKNELWVAGRRIGKRCAIVEMGWWESMEIDDPEDLLVARALVPVIEEDSHGKEMHPVVQCETAAVHVQEAPENGGKDAAKDEGKEATSSVENV